MRIFLSLSLIALLFLFSCQEARVSEVISEVSKYEKAYMTVDTLRIELTEKQKFIYKKFGTVSHNAELYFVGYNDILHSFDVFNLDKSTFVRSIPLQREGPNGIPDLIGFTPVGVDCLYILGATQLVRVNSKGEIEDKIGINHGNTSISGHNPNKDMFWLETDEPLYYDNETHSIYGKNHSYQYGQCDPRRYKNRDLVVRLELEGERMSTVPVRLPQEKADGSYGFIDKTFTNWSHDQLIYNFASDPNIYVMDRNSERVKVYDGHSFYTNNVVTPLSWSACNDYDFKVAHYIREVQFEKVMTDPHRGLYYRFHRKELPIDKPKGHEFNDKKLFLTIFDDAFAKAQEFILDNRSYPTHVSFVGEKGLYVSAPEGDDTMVFYIFDVHTIKRQTNDPISMTF